MANNNPYLIKVVILILSHFFNIEEELVILQNTLRTSTIGSKKY